MEINTLENTIEVRCVSSSVLHSPHQQRFKSRSSVFVMVPSHEWFLYGFVRKEALISSQIEGTQATLEDAVVFEVTRKSERLADTEEVCKLRGGIVLCL